VLGAIAKLVEQVVYNRDNCQLVARRCQSIQVPLRQCMAHFEAQGNCSAAQLNILHDLQVQLTTIQSLVQHYTSKGWVRQGLGSRAFKQKFERFDSNLGKMMADLQLGLSTEMLAQNKALLDQVRCFLISSYLDFLVSLSSIFSFFYF
jgi:hypothetical protein